MYNADTIQKTEARLRELDLPCCKKEPTSGVHATFVFHTVRQDIWGIISSFFSVEQHVPLILSIDWHCFLSVPHPDLRKVLLLDSLHVKKGLQFFVPIPSAKRHLFCKLAFKLISWLILILDEHRYPLNRPLQQYRPRHEVEGQRRWSRRDLAEPWGATQTPQERDFNEGNESDGPSLWIV